MRLTDLFIKSIPLPETGQKTYGDDVVKGFGVRISQGGTRSFVLMHGRNRQLTTIGRVGIITLSDARAEARRLLAQRTLGTLQQRSDISFGDAFEEFIAGHEGKERTKEEYRYLFKRHLLPKFRLERLDRVSTADITKVIDKLRDRPAEASHTHAAASVFFNWARSRRHIERSPLEGIKKPFQGPPRERVLSDDEIKTMFLAEDDSAISKIARLVLLTGQRPGQFARLHADYIQEDRIAWPAAAMKWQKRFANRQHIVPLLPMARAILQTLPSEGLLFKSRSGGEFTNWSNGKRLFDERIGLSNYTCQDCRRTTATKLGDLDVLPHVIDLLQAHRLHGTSAIHTIYNKAIYFEPMRQALQIWEARIKVLLSTTENTNARPHDC